MPRTDAYIHIRPHHAGQLPIHADPARFKVLRCGRRFGKSEFGIIETLETIGDPQRQWGFRHGPRIGWFTPMHKYTVPIYRALADALQPVARAVNASEMTITLPAGGVVECWSLHNNPDAGRSRQYDLAVIDEAGLVAGLRPWFNSALRQTLMDRRGKLLMLGTPHAISPEFNDFFDEAKAGAEGWKAWQCSTFDNPFIPLDELERIRRLRATMPEWLWLQEYMGVPADTAAGIFGRQMVRDYITAFCTEPTWRGRIGLDTADEWKLTAIMQGKNTDAIFAFDDDRGPWSVWGEPDDERIGDIGIGVDLSAGVGSSNTTMSVGTADDRRKFAAFASPGVTPEEAARVAAAAGFYFGGRERPALIWFEANGGGGEQFARELLRLQYPRIRYRTNEQWATQGVDPSRLGWWSTPAAKESLVLGYAGDLRGRKFANPDEKAMRETLTYIYQSGKVVSINPDSDGLEELARAPHGDRVIADALLCDLFKFMAATKTPPQKPPPGSVAERMAEHKAATTRKGW